MSSIDNILCNSSLAASKRKIITMFLSKKKLLFKVVLLFIEIKALKDIAKIKSTYLIPLLPLNLSNHNKKLARI